MAGISYFHIAEIPDIGQDVRIITMGQVLSILKEQKFLSFVVSDTTSTAQATIYQRKSEYEQQQLPQVGDTIEMLGTCLTKSIIGEKSKLFLKVRIQRWRIVDEFDDELQLSEKIITARQQRVEKKLLEQIVVLKKKIRVKQRAFTDKQMVDIRSLIFSYLYIIFQSNADIQSYVFMLVMVRNHSLCKQYARENEIPQKSMQQAIAKGLSYLLAHEIIEVKVQQPGEVTLYGVDQYVIKKRFFERLVVDIEEFVYEKKATGAMLQQVTKAMNQKMGKFKEEDFLFNFKFIQKILMNLIKEFRIFKTSDKKVYPYSY